MPPDEEEEGDTEPGRTKLGLSSEEKIAFVADTSVIMLGVWSDIQSLVERSNIINVSMCRDGPELLLGLQIFFI